MYDRSPHMREIAALLSVISNVTQVLHRGGLTLEIREVAFLKKGWVSEGTGDAYATIGELVTDVRRAEAVSA